MSSGFWFLKDGRGYSKRVRFMVDLLEAICKELKLTEGSEAFVEYLSEFLFIENRELNKHGEYVNSTTGEIIIMDIDFREFTTENQNIFWEAAQSLYKKLVRKNSIKDRVQIKELKLLLDMHKRAMKGGNPMNLNHLESTKPPTGEKKGPGWD